MKNIKKALHKSNSQLVILHYLVCVGLALLIFDSEVSSVNKVYLLALFSLFLFLTVRYIVVINTYPSHLQIKGLFAKKNVPYKDIEYIEETFGWLWRVKFKNPHHTVYFYSVLDRNLIKFLKSKVTIYFISDSKERFYS